MGGDLSRPEFEERCFRFSVRCDRETNQRIETAARKAGLSVTAFVQQHFDTILDGPADAYGFSPDLFARRHGIGSKDAQLFGALRRLADSDGVVTGSVADFAATAGWPGQHLNYHFKRLLKAGLVDTIAAARGGKKGTYRILQVAP